MANARNHIELANKDHDLLEHLLHDPARFAEWIAVVAFYKALHVFDALCVETKGRPPHGHGHRIDLRSLA